VKQKAAVQKGKCPVDEIDSIKKGMIIKCQRLKEEIQFMKL
jgi:hypothetical protein